MRATFKIWSQLFEGIEVLAGTFPCHWTHTSNGGLWATRGFSWALTSGPMELVERKRLYIHIYIYIYINLMENLHSKNKTANFGLFRGGEG